MSIRRFLFGVRTVQLLSQISSSLGSPFFSVLLIPLMFHVFSLFLPPVFHSDKSDTAVPVLLPFFPVYGNGFLRCFYMQTFIFHRFYFPSVSFSSHLSFIRSYSSSCVRWFSIFKIRTTLLFSSVSENSLCH